MAPLVRGPVFGNPGHSPPSALPPGSKTSFYLLFVVIHLLRRTTQTTPTTILDPTPVVVPVPTVADPPSHPHTPTLTSAEEGRGSGWTDTRRGFPLGHHSKVGPPGGQSSHVSRETRVWGLPGEGLDVTWTGLRCVRVRYGLASYPCGRRGPTGAVPGARSGFVGRLGGGGRERTSPGARPGKIEDRRTEGGTTRRGVNHEGRPGVGSGTRRQGGCEWTDLGGVDHRIPGGRGRQGSGVQDTRRPQTQGNHGNHPHPQREVDE